MNPLKMVFLDGIFAEGTYMEQNILAKAKLENIFFEN